MAHSPRPRVRHAIGFIAILVLSSLIMFGCSSAPSPSANPGVNEGANPEANAGSNTNPNQKARAIEAGVEAPDFEFTTTAGDTAKLSDYRGKVVVLNFWATWCGYCMREMPDLNQIDKTFDDVAVVAINRGDTPAKAQAKAEDLGYDFAWGLDENGAIEALYPANGIPYTIIIDKNGIVSATFAGSAADMYARLEAAVTKAGAGA